MNRIVKAGFGLALVAVLAFSAVGAISASATTSGHFVSESAETKLDLTGATGTSHDASLSLYGVTISCHQIDYAATNFTTTTTQSITMSGSTFTNCTTGNGGTLTIRMNGCHFSLTSRSTGHATTHFHCPEGKKAELETPQGLMKLGAQTPTGGATFTAITIENKPAITGTLTAEGIVAECHGACQILGTTTTTGKFTGSLTAQGTNAATGAPTGIQAT